MQAHRENFPNFQTRLKTPWARRGGEKCGQVMEVWGNTNHLGIKPWSSSWRDATGINSHGPCCYSWRTSMGGSPAFIAQHENHAWTSQIHHPLWSPPLFSAGKPLKYTLNTGHSEDGDVDKGAPPLDRACLRQIARDLPTCPFCLLGKPDMAQMVDALTAPWLNRDFLCTQNWCLSFLWGSSESV